MAYEIGHKSRALHDVERQLMMLCSAVDVYGDLLKKGEGVEATLAAIYRKRGTVFWCIQKPEAALADYDRAIEIRERLDAEGRLLDRCDLAGVYMNRAGVHADMQKPEDALADYDQALKIMESLGAEETAYVEKYRPMVTASRENILLLLRDFWKLVVGYLEMGRTPSAAGAASTAEGLTSTESRESVSDSIFARREWRYLSEEEKGAIGSEKAAPSVEASSSAASCETKRHRLSFYDRTTLLEISGTGTGAGGGSIWILDNEGVFSRLDGRSDPIHDANEACSIELTQDTLIDYLRFFCFFVHGDEGPFFIVQDLDHPMFDQEKLDAERRATLEKELRPPEILEVSENGVFKVAAVVMYGNALFRAVFAVLPKGFVEMVDEEPRVADIPAKKLKPWY